MPELLQLTLPWAVPALTAAWLASYLVRTSVRTFTASSEST